MTTSDYNKYFVDDTLKDDDQSKWLLLLEYAFNLADHVEFNILLKSKDLNSFLETFSSSITDRGKREKIYAHREFIRLRLTDDVKAFIKAKNYSEWHNKFIEDISFLKDGLEFFATITHENYVIIKLAESDRNDFNKKGFCFEIEWPYPYK